MSHRCAAVAFAAALTVAFGTLVPGAHARAQPAPVDLMTARFVTAVGDPAVLWTSHAERGLQRTRGAGASAFRIWLSWAHMVPGGTERPLWFDPKNPSDPNYWWGYADRAVKSVVAHGLEPIICIFDAPLWAEDQRVDGIRGTRRPDPAALAEFAKTVATRYSGRFAGLPRVRYWQIWNEPNLPTFLSPQVVDGQPVSPSWYRSMLNQAGAAIRSVQPDAAVVAGSLAPFGAYPTALAPFHFMRELLCMSGDWPPRPGTCAERSAFDIWSHHPYSAGGPDQPAKNAGDAQVADLPAMRTLLTAAVRAGRVAAAAEPRFWVTEFGWDTNPPDPAAPPERLQARWVAEALHRMWRSGVSLVTWFQLRDTPMGVSFAQTGLYFDDGPEYRLDQPKLALYAFRFPFVAYTNRRRVAVWGRAPGAPRRFVVVEHGSTAGWTRIIRLRTDGDGIFAATVRAPLVGYLRARIPSGEASLPFSLVRPPDVAIRSPFGS